MLATLRAISLTCLALALSMAGTAAADEAWSYKVFGRAQFDYTSASADLAALDISSSELRTGRLGISGKSGGALSFKLEFATDSSGDISLTDAYLALTPGQRDWTILIGQFKTPNALDEQTSGRFGAMQERAGFTDAFEFNRLVGIAASTRRETWTFMAGLFGGNLNDTASEEGWAAAARGTWTPVTTDDLTVHIGGSLRYRERGDAQSQLRYRQRPFAHSPGRIISTGRLGDNDMFYGIEAAALYGNGWLAGEYALLNADCTACTGSDPRFTGAYAEAGWMWGGQRGYKNGKFDRPEVTRTLEDGGIGALAVAARFDTLDLTDASVDGGALDTASLALDWYPTRHTRLSLNLYNSDAALGTSTSGIDNAFATLITNGITSDSVQGATLRLQFDF